MSSSVCAGQIWRDRDKRSPYTVTVTKVTSTRVFYDRGPIHTSSRADRFVKRFRYEGTRLYPPVPVVRAPEER